MFQKAVRKIESFHALMKFCRPTKTPILPTLVLVSDSHTPITNGYAMNSPSRTTVGVSRTNASSRSFSRKRVHPVGREVPGWGRTASRPTAPPDPPEIGFLHGVPFTGYP